MTTTDPERTIEAILATSLARVLEFLKYAEAKNGALLTFSSAWILAVLALLTGDKHLPWQLIVACEIALLFFGSGAAISLYSFFPKLSLERFTRLHSVRHKPNLVYFGEVAELAIDDFERQIRLRYSPTTGSEVSAEYISDMAVQIRINSSIVKRKLRLFATGLLVVGSGIAIVFLPLIALAFDGFRRLIWG
jgi:Family of unknown function (DUF5706)